MVADEHHRYLEPGNRSPVTVLGEDEDGKVWYVRGHVPIFSTFAKDLHDEST